MANIVDPVEMLIKTTSSLLVPIPTTTKHHHHTSISPIPTVTPNPDIYEVASDSGKRTLW